jgi:hypothetical protein
VAWQPHFRPGVRRGRTPAATALPQFGAASVIRAEPPAAADERPPRVSLLPSGGECREAAALDVGTRLVRA